MQKRRLGKSDMLISEISFGCMSLGYDHKLNELLINKAIDAGINLFDTADLYDKGRNEITLGKALKEKRGKIFISTKVGNEWKADGNGWDWNPSKDYILRAIDNSLDRLRTNYIDLYQLHGGTIEDPIDETIEAFEILKTQGKIRHYGISSIRPNVIRKYVKKSNIVSVMMQYSLLDRRPEEEVTALLESKEIGILARGSLAKGLLVNKTPASYLNYSALEVEELAAIIHKLATASKKASHVSLGYVLDNLAVSTAVVGIRNLEQLEDIVKGGSSFDLSNEEIKILSSVIPINKYDQHR